MQMVGVSIRLRARDVANVEALCKRQGLKPSEWYRQAISIALKKELQAEASQEAGDNAR